MAGDGPNILVVGYSAFDVIVPVAEFPLPDSKSPVGEIVIGGGGPGATAAVALARLGAGVKLVTPLTDDLPGRLQREELAEAGVDLSLSPMLPGRRSPKAVILVDSHREERTVFWSRGELPALAPDCAAASWLEDIDLLLVDGHECALAARVAALASKRGLPVVMDAGSVREGSRELVARCSDVICSDRFASTFTGVADPVGALRALAACGPEYVATTCGSEGVLALVQGHPTAWPAFDVPTLDTTGAGDAFHAGYAYQRALGRPLPECLEFGSAVAALKCRDWGGRRGLPFPGEAEMLIAEGTRRPLGAGLKDFPRYGS